MPWEAATTLMVHVEGFDMPGISCAPEGAGQCYDNVHVGVQRRREVVETVRGDADEARWSFEVVVKHDGDDVDFGGPFVHGRRGERFLYLSWGAGTGDDIVMFRRAKLVFADAGPEVLAAAVEGGVLRCRVRMTDGLGNPRCARARPPDAVWSAAPVRPAT